MQIGMVGLGRMGGNMVRRLARGGASVVAWDRSPEARTALVGEPGVEVADTLEGFVAALPPPRTAWLMLPAGGPTDQVLEALAARLAPGDLLVDGGNAHYQDSQRRAAALAARGLQFVDAGVSGGVWGLHNGYGLMVGGAPAAVARLEPALRLLAPAPDLGWLHCGAAGAGHYAKMIHNGIEYGLMQAYAEGFALLQARPDLGLDVARLAEHWRHGTVIRSWLLDLVAEFLAKEGALEGIAPVVADSGEGRWTAKEAIDLGVPAPVISAALMARFASQGRDDYAARLLARMRQAFGGHAVMPAGTIPP
ncbi:MAG: decarboxylating 6-phosphogluconate dehydrogenase [Steroidobacteraceae bacterium]|jgi:6-phosphogluconate dehydrogenase|nr:decarboxylating 6-phosphogluconate dehydrogenase [Steroidobacteraceae bacterium]